MIKEMLYVLIILLGIPTGLFLSNLCKEELESWKHRVSSMALFSFLLTLILYFTTFEYRVPVMVSLLFMVVTFVSIVVRSGRNIEKRKMF